MANTSQTREEFVITRSFNAPRQLVWDAFTKAEHLAHWWGPKGFKLEVFTCNVKPGGIFHYRMSADNGHEMWGRFNYFKVDAPNSIEFTSSFSNKEGDIAPAPFFDGKWPLEVYNTWTFEEQDGKTTITLSGLPYNATDAEHELFESNKPSMNQGFGGTFDQLDEYLKELSTQAKN